MRLEAIFLGVGSAIGAQLGNSSMVLVKDEEPWLMVDCGFDSLERYKSTFSGALPPALFITHCHYDHIGGLEQLYFQSRFSQHKPRIYLSHHLVSSLVDLLHNTGLSEGGENIWDVLDLVPVSGYFYHQGVCFQLYPARHHRHLSAFSLHLPGHFFYSGDTRPVPEVIHHSVCQNELIFHDCCVLGNPSHSGIEDLKREYLPDVIARIRAYHYHSASDVRAFNDSGIGVVRVGEVVPLSISKLNIPSSKVSVSSLQLN